MSLVSLVTRVTAPLTAAALPGPGLATGAPPTAAASAFTVTDLGNISGGTSNSWSHVYQLNPSSIRGGSYHLLFKAGNGPAIHVATLTI